MLKEAIQNRIAQHQVRSAEHLFRSVDDNLPAHEDEAKVHAKAATILNAVLDVLSTVEMGKELYHFSCSLKPLQTTEDAQEEQQSEAKPT
ncbi:MAG TPA: hypothetical protein VEH27_11900 [Methylomirabilota bacterium]|nr:hypothetical protein [Methylomirabilota bacterium]